MNKQNIDKRTRTILINSQKAEITEYNVYKKLAQKAESKNKNILNEIAEDELAHYRFWQRFTDREVKPNWIKVYFYYILAHIFGLMFSIKLMEKGEEDAQEVYMKVSEVIPEAKKIVSDEDRHEDKLLNMLEEEKLNYVGSMVFGLNDALVELTGTLAGLTFALQNTNLIALSGLITGIAASLSMGASEYLSTRTEENGKNELKSSFYTAITYIITVILLILPYFLLENYIFSLILTIIIAVVIIFVFNFYISVAKDLNFKKRFIEMASISLGVSLISFGIGVVVRILFGVEI
ncbi:MAG: VIT1/CCC1 transporter family protein [Halanaerobiales bacterium]